MCRKNEDIECTLSQPEFSQDRTITSNDPFIIQNASPQAAEAKRQKEVPCGEENKRHTKWKRDVKS